MIYPLIGLEGFLSDQKCTVVELSSAQAESRLTYTRSEGDLWDSGPQESAEMHTGELVSVIGAKFGGEFDTLTVVVGTEQVVYTLSAGSVRMERSPADLLRPGKVDTYAPSRELSAGLGIPASKRKYKLTQAVQFSQIVEQSLSSVGEERIRILDVACGRSYLGFVLVERLSRRADEVSLFGIDSSRELVDRCRQIRDRLKWPNCEFEIRSLSSFNVEAGACDIVVALHACDTLTDHAIRVGVRSEAPLLFFAPCCQHEFRHLWESHPLEWISRYGLLEQRLADVLTDGFRCLVLESLGYRVNVFRFTSAAVTPKNVLIRAERQGRTNPDRVRAARDFLKQFNIRPTLAALLP